MVVAVIIVMIAAIAVITIPVVTVDMGVIVIIGTDRILGHGKRAIIRRRGNILFKLDST